MGFSPYIERIIRLKKTDKYGDKCEKSHVPILNEASIKYNVITLLRLVRLMFNIHFTSRALTHILHLFFDYKISI